LLFDLHTAVSESYQLTDIFYHRRNRINRGKLQMIIIIAGGARNSSTCHRPNILLAKSILLLLAVRIALSE
jgi:hypothetical protein